MDISYTAASVRHKSGIYAITHTASGKQYVGSAASMGHRWASHRYNLRHSKHNSVYLQRAWDKYGPSAFIFTVLEFVPGTGDLVEREQFWIDTLRPVYNTCPAAGSTLGLKMTPAFRQACSERAQKVCTTVEFRQKIGAISKQLWEDPVYRQRVSEGLRKHWADPANRTERTEKNRAAQTPEAIAKRIASMTGGKRSPETRAKMAEARRKWLAENPEKVAAAIEKRRGQKRTPEQVQNILRGRGKLTE